MFVIRSIKGLQDSLVDLFDYFGVNKKRKCLTLLLVSNRVTLYYLFVFNYVAWKSVSTYLAVTTKN